MAYAALSYLIQCTIFIQPVKLMESLSMIFSSSPLLLPRTLPKLPKLHSFQPHFILKPHLPLILMQPIISLPSLASIDQPPDVVLQSSERINLEQIVVSIDDFFNRYPFFVAGVTFIWLIVIPLTEEYLRKYKFISALGAFKKLKEDQSCQLLDIRDEKSVAFLDSPDLKMFKKSVVQVPFSEDEGAFVKKVLEKLNDPEITSVCILDNFDGNSMKVAELLFTSGFKETYAIKGGVRGKKGWQEIQEDLLPPSLHMFRKKKVSKPRPPMENENANQQEVRKHEVKSKSSSNGYVKMSGESNSKGNPIKRSSSPYPNYPDLRPPSSPTPSKPRT